MAGSGNKDSIRKTVVYARRNQRTLKTPATAPRALPGDRLINYDRVELTDDGAQHSAEAVSARRHQQGRQYASVCSVIVSFVICH